MFVPEREYYIPESLLRRMLELYYRYDVIEGKSVNNNDVEEYIEAYMSILDRRSAYR